MRPVVVVTVEVAGKRYSVDARIYTLSLECGCWGHSYSGPRVIEVAISPGGTPVGMRTRTDHPFTAQIGVGPIRVFFDNADTIILQEQRDRDEAMARIEHIKHKQLEFSEQQETSSKKARKK